MGTKMKRILAMVLLLSFVFSTAAAEAPEEEWEEAEETLVSSDTCFFLVSDPIGGNRGAAVRFEIIMNGGAEEKDLLFRWYEQTDLGGKGTKLLETKELYYETEPFDKPEVHAYWLDVIDGGRIAETYACAAGFTGLPVLRIDLMGEEEVYSKEEYQRAEMELIDTDGSRIWETLEIKGRGQATWNYPKKPYRIKFQQKTALFGMEPHKKWELLANYCDKTLLRTSIGFETARKLDMAYVPESCFTELVINGEYAGNYQLTETVGDGKKALGITETGYMLEVTGYDNEIAFRTEERKYPFRFKIPDAEDVTEEMKQNAEKTMNSFEKKLYASKKKAFDPEKGYAALIDMDSWAQWFLLLNILENRHPNRYYYREDADAPIKMGPFWDFEWSIGIGWYDGERPKQSHTLMGLKSGIPYFGKMLKDPAFLQNVKEKWDRIYPTLWEEMRDYIRKKASEIEVSQAMNFKRWPILKEQVFAGGIPLGSWENELECDMAFLESHIEWLDKEIQKRAGE